MKYSSIVSLGCDACLYYIQVFVLNMDIMLLQVILLDTRYHRDPFFSDGTILGDSQWKWLEKELDGPKSQLTIIASSIQVNQSGALQVVMNLYFTYSSACIVDIFGA